MKRLSLMFLILFMFTSCSVFDVRYSKKPEKTAEKFLKHLYNAEYDKAKKYGTDKTARILDIMDQLVAISGQNPLPAEPDIKISECIIRNDTAYCYYLAKGEKQEIMLLKKDKQWLVDLKKEAKSNKDKK